MYDNCGIINTITNPELALCEDTLKKEGASEEEIQDELNIILTQQAYTQQRRGKETAEIYEKVLKTKYVTFPVMQIVLQ